MGAGGAHDGKLSGAVVFKLCAWFVSRTLSAPELGVSSSAWAYLPQPDGRRCVQVQGARGGLLEHLPD